uniref:Translocator protein n=1 Tax=Lygus hesperus TaxID=30085 RepID=A0A0A9XM68_LYGHE
MSIIWMIDLTFAPLIGYGFTYNATEFLKEPCPWLDEASQPSWAIEYEHEKLYSAWLVGSNILAGLSSVLLYRLSAEMEESARIGLDLPLTLYFGQVVLWWFHYPLVHYLCSLPMGWIDITMAGVASAIATFYYAEYSLIACGMMIPYVALMWYHIVWDTFMLWRTYKDSRRGRK